MTITLRPARAADATWLGSWLPAVARSVAFDELTDDAAIQALVRDRSRVVRVIERDASSVGLAVAATNVPERGSAIIQFIGTPPSEARRGAGMRAAALIEEELRGLGVKRIYAPAPAVHGIAMYFWIRLGYRPLLRPEWPCEREGIAWLAREL